MRVLQKQVTLDIPVRRLIHVVVVARSEAVLKNAAHLDSRQGEDHRLVLHPTLFFHGLQVRLARKRNDGAIGMNRARDDTVQRLVISYLAETPA